MPRGLGAIDRGRVIKHSKNGCRLASRVKALAAGRDDAGEPFRTPFYFNAGLHRGRGAGSRWVRTEGVLIQLRVPFCVIESDHVVGAHRVKLNLMSALQPFDILRRADLRVFLDADSGLFQRQMTEMSWRTLSGQSAARRRHASSMRKECHEKAVAATFSTHKRCEKLSEPVIKRVVGVGVSCSSAKRGVCRLEEPRHCTPSSISRMAPAAHNAVPS